METAKEFYQRKADYNTARAKEAKKMGSDVLSEHCKREAMTYQEAANQAV